MTILPSYDTSANGVLDGGEADTYYTTAYGQVRYADVDTKFTVSGAPGGNYRNVRWQDGTPVDPRAPRPQAE